MSRQRYPEEFKIEAVKQVTEKRCEDGKARVIAWPVQWWGRHWLKAWPMPGSTEGPPGRRC